MLQLDVSVGYILEKKHENIQSYVYASRNSRVIDEIRTVSTYPELQGAMDDIRNADVQKILLENR